MELFKFAKSLKMATKRIIPPQYHVLLDKIYYFYLPLRGLLYLGNQFTCPCCNKTFSKFLPAQPGQKLVEMEKCPNCDSFRRQRVLWLYLKNQTNLFSEKLRILHIAPEYCFQKNLDKMCNLDYISADLSSPLAKQKIDITNIPYPDNCFDVILCNHVLEHIPDDHQAMRELLRVLKSTGWAILQVPLDRKRDKTFEDPTVVSPQERQRLFWQHDHVRLYGLDYKNRLEEIGFIVKVESYIKTLESDTIEKYGLADKEDIYFCTKSKNS